MTEIIEKKCTPFVELVPGLINLFAKTTVGDPLKYISVY